MTIFIFCILELNPFERPFEILRFTRVNSSIRYFAPMEFCFLLCPYATKLSSVSRRTELAEFATEYSLMNLIIRWYKFIINTKFIIIVGLWKLLFLYFPLISRKSLFFYQSSLFELRPASLPE